MAHDTIRLQVKFRTDTEVREGFAGATVYQRAKEQGKAPLKNVMNETFVRKESQDCASTRRVRGCRRVDNKVIKLSAECNVLVSPDNHWHRVEGSVS